MSEEAAIHFIHNTLASHILKPSPLFKEVYVVGTMEEKTCEIEDQYILEKEGTFFTEFCGLGWFHLTEF